MKKILEVKLNSQLNYRAEARALEEAFNLKTGLRDSEKYFEENNSKLTNEEAVKILNNEYKIINQIRDMFNLKEIYENGKFVLYAEMK